ncbi:MAG TPA: plastocyanin/azurin family copper-binding protein [Nitrososphaera sp.]|jgi:plastocyanin
MASSGIIIAIIVGLGAAIGLVLVLSNTSIFATPPASSNATRDRITLIPAVIIPEGAGLASSGKSFEPETIKVMIGVNNTVRWINQDRIAHWIRADDQSDPEFYNATGGEPGNKMILPGESFEYTFTKAGEFGYHGKPVMRGTVIVLESEK